MAIFNVIDSTSGVFSQIAGSAAEVATGSYGFSPFKLAATAVVSASADTGTLNIVTVKPSFAGLITVSGTGAAIKLIMPRAQDVPGAYFVIQSLSAHAHTITGSQETSGQLAFSCNYPVAQGSLITLSGSAQAGISLVSDGYSYQVISYRTGSTNTTNGMVISGA